MPPGSDALIGSNGGGFSVLGSGSTLYFAKSMVSDCHARLQGGAFYMLQGGRLVMTDSTATGCTAPQGGAFSNEFRGNVKLVRSTVEACMASEEGGAVFQSNDPSNVFRAIDSSFVGCQSAGDGGVLTIIAGRASITGGRTTDCEARFGGAVQAQGGNLDIDGHVFTDCTATVDGGVLLVDHKTMNMGAHTTLTGCIMINCHSTRGGVISIVTGVATVQDCTMQGARASLGGSVIVSGGKLSLLRTNISDSEAAIGGGDLYVDGGEADVQGCVFERGRSLGGVGGSVVVASGMLRIVGSIIRASSIQLTNGVGAAFYVAGGRLDLQAVQILDCAVPSPPAGGLVYVSKEARFRAVLLESELDCSGSIVIVSEDPARVLDVAGLSLFPSECATPPQATQISNARLIGCSDHSACGVAADCTEVAVSNLTINTLLCSCTGLNTPQQSVRPQSVSVETALRVAPYIGGSEGGCTTLRRATRQRSTLSARRFKPW